MKINRILLPFDGSVHSMNAAHYTLGLAKMAGATVAIVHCYEWRGDVSELPEILADELKTTALSKAEEILKKAQEVFTRQGVEYTLEAINSPPAQELTKRAKSKEYDMIIMGSHGHSDIAGLFLGSVTHKVLNTIYCPVLIVP